MLVFCILYLWLRRLFIFSYLQAFENHNWSNVSEEIKPEAMEQIIEFIYSGTIPIDSGNVCSLLVAANFMNLDG